MLKIMKMKLLPLVTALAVTLVLGACDGVESIAGPEISAEAPQLARTPAKKGPAPTEPAPDPGQPMKPFGGYIIVAN